MITKPLETAIQGRNFAIPIPREEIAIPVNPKVAIKDTVTRMPIIIPLLSLLAEIKRELLFALRTFWVLLHHGLAIICRIRLKDKGMTIKDLVEKGLLTNIEILHIHKKASFRKASKWEELYFWEYKMKLVEHSQKKSYLFPAMSPIPIHSLHYWFPYD